MTSLILSQIDLDFSNSSSSFVKKNMYLVALNSFRYPLISGSWTTNSLICSSFFFYWLNISSSSDTNIIYIDSLFWAMTVFSILTSPNFKKSLVRFFIPLWAISLLAYVGKQYFCNQERVNGVFLFLVYFWLWIIGLNPEIISFVMGQPSLHLSL